MKKQIFILSIVMFFGTLSGYSQIKEGDKLVGGSFSFNVSSEVTETPQREYLSQIKTSGINFSVTPEMGYFISNRWAIGVRAGYGVEKDVEEWRYKDKAGVEDNKRDDINQNFRVGPFTRYYFELGNGFYFFGEAEVNVHYMTGISEFKNRSDKIGYSETQINAGIHPGLTFFVNDRVGLFFNTNELLGYHYRTTERTHEDPDFDEKQTNESERSHVNTNFNLSHLFRPSNLSIGVNLYLD